MMIGDENVDDSMSVVSTYSKKRMPIQIQAKPTPVLVLRTVTEESKLTTRSSLVSLDCSPATRPVPVFTAGTMGLQSPLSLHNSIFSVEQLEN